MNLDPTIPFWTFHWGTHHDLIHLIYFAYSWNLRLHWLTSYLIYIWDLTLITMASFNHVVLQNHPHHYLMAFLIRYDAISFTHFSPINSFFRHFIFIINLFTWYQNLSALEYWWHRYFVDIILTNNINFFLSICA
jgi:hypothetical protein